MPTQKRTLPPKNIHRFNYWEFFHPGGRNVIAPLKQHIQHQFNLLLNRPLYALMYLVEHDKEWGSDKTAQAVLKQLSPRHKTVVLRHFRTTWPERSKRPARVIRTWENLFREIAQDIDTFERFCDVPPTADEQSGTPKRIYLSYRTQAIKLLGGGGTYIRPELRSHYQVPNIFDESDDPTLIPLLNARGRIASQSIIKGINWLTLARQDRREAEKRTLHWFCHALRNLREYRNRRPPIPWTAECDKRCRDIQKQLLTARS